LYLLDKPPYFKLLYPIKFMEKYSGFNKFTSFKTVLRRNSLAADERETDKCPGPEYLNIYAYIECSSLGQEDK